MIALVQLGWRLAKAGGALRAWSIIVGNAVGAVFLLIAAVLPAAMYPNPNERAAMRLQTAGTSLFLLIPAAVLLITVGRLSSGLRDRRLAALMPIGPREARVRRQLARQAPS